MDIAGDVNGQQIKEYPGYQSLKRKRKIGKVLPRVMKVQRRTSLINREQLIDRPSSLNILKIVVPCINPRKLRNFPKILKINGQYYPHKKGITNISAVTR